MNIVINIIVGSLALVLAMAIVYLFVDLKKSVEYGEGEQAVTCFEYMLVMLALFLGCLLILKLG